MFHLSRIAVMSAVVLVASLTSFNPASAASSSALGHDCVVDVIGQSGDGTFVLSEPVCFATFGEVLEYKGVETSAARSATPESASDQQLLAASIIGTHYENSGGGGASISISGDSCTGGGLNVASAWNDRISSSRGGCGTIVHYENANYTGATLTTYGSGISNVSGYMDNRTTSIKYF